MGKQNDPVSLDIERSRKFLRRLAEDPFLAIVVAADGEVSIYGKGIDSAHLERIKSALTEIQSEG